MLGGVLEEQGYGDGDGEDGRKESVVLKGQTIAFLSLRHFLHIRRHELIMNHSEEGVLCWGSFLKKPCLLRSSRGETEGGTDRSRSPQPLPPL